MLSFLTAHSGGAAADAVVPVALHRSWVRLDSEALVRWSSEIRQDLFWWWAHERLELVSSFGRGFSPVALWSDSSYVGWALVSTFSGFRVDPEPIGVSAASVKVGGVPRPVRNHTFSPLLALNALFVLWGPECPWFSELLDLVVDDSVALPLDRDLLSPASGAVTTSGSVQACCSYLVSIQRFFSSRVFSRRVA